MDRRKRISNASETATRRILEDVVPDECKVFEKIRIADALDIHKSGLSEQEFGYALKAHFDFVVTDTATNALFAVEFDGPHHARRSAIEIDTLKDSICKKLGMPLLRVSSEFLAQRTERFTLLGWIVELWFVARGFREQQENGVIPAEADFTYWATSTVSVVDGRAVFRSYDLAGPDQRFLITCYKEGITKDRTPSIYRLMGDPKGYIVALGCIRIDNEAIIVGEARFRSYNFSPISTWELSADFVTMDTAKKLGESLRGSYCPRSKGWADRRVDELRKLGERCERGVSHCGPADIYGSDNSWNDLPPEIKEMI